MLVEAECPTLPRVDREFYVVQSEFYHEPLDNTNGNTIVEPSYPRGLDETADVVVFNGKVRETRAQEQAHEPAPTELRLLLLLTVVAHSLSVPFDCFIFFLFSGVLTDDRSSAASSCR